MPSDIHMYCNAFVNILCICKRRRGAATEEFQVEISFHCRTKSNSKNVLFVFTFLIRIKCSSENDQEQAYSDIFRWFPSTIQTLIQIEGRMHNNRVSRLHFHGPTATEQSATDLIDLIKLNNLSR